MLSKLPVHSLARRKQISTPIRQHKKKPARLFNTCMYAYACARKIKFTNKQKEEIFRLGEILEIKREKFKGIQPC